MRISKKITEWYLGENSEKERAVPKQGVQRFLYMAWNQFGKLFLMNLLFLLCCIPILTIPAAFCALNRYVMKMYRTGYGFGVEDYLKEFKQELIKSLPFGVLLGAVGFYAVYLLSMSLQFEAGWQGMLIQLTGIICLILVTLIGSYSFLLLSMLGLRNTQILKNACILILCEWKANLLLILTAVISWGVVLIVFPYGIVFPLVGLFAIRQLAIVSILNPVVEQKILQPYERQQQYEKSLL